MRLITPVILTAVISTTVLLSGCKGSNGGEQRSNQPIAVSIQEVRPFSSEMEIAYSGTIEEALSVPLTFSVLGTVSEVRVNEGDRVHKGQLLATLNSESWQNSYDIATAKLSQAEDAYRRMQPMHESGSLPAIKWVEVETGVQQARATAALAKKNLDDCKLYATMDGIVGKRSIEPGVSVSPAFSAITLVRIDTVYAKISVSEGEIAAIKKDMTAGVIIPALGHVRREGIVEQVGVMADPLMHTYKVKIAIPNQDQALLPGMLCNVAVVDSSNQTGVIIPTGCAIVDENGKYYLFVADIARNIAQRREVTPGSFVKTGLEITSGLQQGEWIVVSGQQKLSDQSPISYRR
jgi:membrane fusion protein (multidrug efflux system)